MRRSFTAILCLALFAGCQALGVSTFWNNRDLDYSDIRAAEDQFADFAELAVAAPEKDALAAMDVLFGKMKQDTVAYYLYSSWMDGAFYHVSSPCRSAALYSRAVDRIVTDGVLSPDEYAPFLRKKEWIQYNQAGQRAVVPGVDFSARSLVLVLDQSCPSCREALTHLYADPQWEGVRKVAVFCGVGPVPEAEGWESVCRGSTSAVFDPHLTPVYFVVSADGTVETPYTPAF